MIEQELEGHGTTRAGPSSFPSDSGHGKHRCTPRSFTPFFYVFYGVTHAQIRQLYEALSEEKKKAWADAAAERHENIEHAVDRIWYEWEAPMD